MSEVNYRFVERENRVSAEQHRVFFTIRAVLLVGFFIWLFAFSENFSSTTRTLITVALIAAVVINLLIARFLQRNRVILAVTENTLLAGVAPHEALKTIDLTQVSRVLVHRQYLMFEQPNQKPIQLIFAGKYRPLQGKLLSFLTQEFPAINIDRMV